jgi:hypothetical protein
VFSDLYEIIQHPPLILPDHCDPASYPLGSPFKIDRESTIDDVCNFVVEYINSDVVVRSFSISVTYPSTKMSPQGLVSDKHITIAGEFPILRESYMLTYILHRSSQRA